MNKYLWVAFPVAFLNAVTFGLYATYGMYYSLFVEDFNSTYSFMGLVGTSVSLFISVFSQANPWIEKTFGYSVCVVVGGLLTALTFFATSYDTNQYEVLFTYSMILGMSGSVSYLVYGHLFENLDAIELKWAFSGIQLGTALFYILFSCFVEYKLHSGSTWRNVFRYYFSVVGLLYTAFAVFFFVYQCRNKSEYTELPTEEVLSEVDLPTRAGSLSEHKSEGNEPAERPVDHRPFLVEEDTGGWVRLLSTTDRCSALAVTISNFLTVITCVVPSKFALIYCTDNGTESEFVNYLVPVVLGSAQILSSVFYGTVAQAHPRFTSFEWCKVGQLGCMGSALLMVLLPTSYSFGIKLAGIALYTFFISIIYSVTILRLFEVVGRRFHVENFSVWLLLSGIAVTSGGYLGGLVYDLTNSFHAVFLLVAITFAISFIYDEILYVRWITLFDSPCKACLSEDKLAQL